MTPLEALAARARHEIALFGYPDREWLDPRRAADGADIRDVVIVGGGHSGTGIAIGLLRARIPNFVVLDENAPQLEGPWVTTARMITLRTLKFLTGPDMGTPALTYRAWHEAQYGPESWERLVRIPRGDWMRYLLWLRATLLLPFCNNARLDAIDFADDHLRLTVRTPAGPATMRTRKLVLATGLSGAGGPFVPDRVRDFLPRDRWSHTSEPIDFPALAGKRVAVIGAGASAFDNAATALEAGAGRVDLFMRRAELPAVNALRNVESVGFFRHFADLPDAQRWRFMRLITAHSTPPPQDTVERTTRHANFALHAGSPIIGIEMAGEAIRLATPHGVFMAEHLIAGTGYAVDLTRRAEFSGFSDHVALWGDRYTPEAEARDDKLARYPYVGPGYQLLPRGPGAPDGLGRIHLFNAGSLMSTGPTAGGINSLPWHLPRLVAGLTHDLFVAEADRMYAKLAAYHEADPWEAVSTQP
jgi:cation diffusion facilitator CzcD-associated flavoprotein CzcO